MEIKLTDKQFEQLQTELIKEAVRKIDNGKKKFIDVTAVFGDINQQLPKTGLVSICIANIVALVDHPNSIVKSDILFNTGRDHFFCTSTVEEIKQMIKEAENNER